jgi:predicted small secreted protein
MKNLLKILLLIALWVLGFYTAFALSGCNTIGGVGKDLVAVSKCNQAEKD